VSAKRTGLGRGFASLIPTELIDESLDPTAAQDEKLSNLRELNLSDVIANPDQPRRAFDEQALDELAASIQEHGVVQPIIVTPAGSNYRIVAGERRFRAAAKAGLDTIPALVRTMSDQHQLEVSLIENIQRRDLNVLETATAYLKLRDQFNLSLEEIGTRVGGKSVSAISNTLRLLRLPETVRKALQEGRLTEGQARPLINADPDVVEKVLPQILNEEWSARRIEQFVVNLKDSKKAETNIAAVMPRHETQAQGWTKRFATKVQVRSNSKGAGTIVIGFKNDAEFDRISKLLDQ
jgi:ParB family chromosome partitioning protein